MRAHACRRCVFGGINVKDGAVRRVSVYFSICRDCLCDCVCVATPLHVILLRRATQPFARGGRRRVARAVRSACAVVLQVVDDAVHFPRLEDGREPLRRVVERLACV